MCKCPVGITEVHAHALPEAKLQLIRDLQAEGHTVAMVGDGTNDAPALALADVGIALGEHSSHVALETADIALAGNDLRHVPAVVELSGHTLRVVRQNYGLAIGVNLLGLVAGAGGSMNPVPADEQHRGRRQFCPARQPHSSPTAHKQRDAQARTTGGTPRAMARLPSAAAQQIHDDIASGRLHAYDGWTTVAVGTY
ncbi:HAD-IC family P-type ATPase [Streptomyces sp. NPDC059567]|uniref:HAD-IC family P-type ATPase n=1 Tax=Streptomyces sp. NPDC059567 TaxID=3346867 RepID=UPI003676F5FE